MEYFYDTAGNVFLRSKCKSQKNADKFTILEFKTSVGQKIGHDSVCFSVIMWKKYKWKKI